MDTAFGVILDEDLFRAVAVIAAGYEEGTLAFLEAHLPSFRAQLDRAEEQVASVRRELLAGTGSLAEWRAALDDLRSLWELASELRREHTERVAVGAPEEIELAGAGV